MTSKTEKKISELIEIIAAAGGELVGRTRLQKTACLLEIAGLGSGYDFRYKHYGPYSEELASAASIAPLFNDFEEEERRSSWGGTYSVFRTGAAYHGNDDDPFKQIVEIARDADPVVLELAATAAFLAEEGHPDPWSETAKRKPEKVSNGRLDRARELYARLKGVPVPREFPDL